MSARIGGDTGGRCCAQLGKDSKGGHGGGKGCPWQREKLLLLFSCAMQEHWGGPVSSFLQKMLKSAFSCEITQFLNIGVIFFFFSRNTKQAKLDTSVCQAQPVGLRGVASGAVLSTPERTWPGGRVSLPSDGVGSLYYSWYRFSRVDQGLRVTVFINTLKNSIWCAECEVGLI